MGSETFPIINQSTSREHSFYPIVLYRTQVQEAVEPDGMVKGVGK
jgi:hypothetical protein